MKEVDVRGYPPCEPMEMALEAASALKDSDKEIGRASCRERV